MDQALKRFKKDSRRTILMKPGTVSFKSNKLGCMVLNISSSGAGLVIESDVPLPFVFDLAIDGTAENRRCLVVWRVERRVGISFDFEPG